jgi:hypothetical protein
MQIVQFVVDLHLVYFGSEFKYPSPRGWHSNIVILGSILLLRQFLLAPPSGTWYLPRDRVGCCVWLRATVKLSPALHQVLHRHVQEADSGQETSYEWTCSCKREWVCALRV